MSPRIPLFLLCLLALAGCEKIQSLGAEDPKVLDAQAIGYACRVSQKTPESCMKENDAHSPSHILSGWKNADQDIKDKVIDVGMDNGHGPASAVPAAPTAEEKKSESH